METTIIREKLKKFIDEIEDKKAEAIYTLFEEEMDTDAQRKKLIQAERKKYLGNEGKSYSWEDVKQMAIHKEKRNAI